MSYKATVVADSYYVNNHRHSRVVTLECVFPRFILPQANTHKSISKSASSSRALGTNKRIIEVSENPFVPEKFGVNQKGMVAGEPLVGTEEAEAREIWLEGSRSAVKTAQALLDLGVHKEIANRPLEPYMWQTNVMTANIEFFLHLLELRLGHDAQPEFQTLAQHMAEALRESESIELYEGEWHLPYVEDNERGFYSIEDLKKISVSRCARTSYGSQGNRNARSDIDLYDFLKKEKHYSPFEMVCTPDPNWELGNIYGWKQLRHEFEDISYYPHR